ncbi:DUF4282 domain-containing protein [Maritalea mediterranea]|uniref:DUF4282 domain-containing protein n=1 Tax=Maritalea mediterranea TaxID=2909667 RepID=A0ABS9E6Y8_9HYPH|nr:DUF4282 domain-containing protein [Maritalea mediterranea]MCF4098644.1 DUF4282 domain-containing protein [Maritalea mediterranea]
MNTEDIKRLATSGTIFNLDRMIAPKIIKLLYLLGLGTIVLWSINHLFATFADSFGSGLWGILEVGIFGLGAFVALRVLCETLLVFFKKNEKLMEIQQPVRPALSIFDDVKDALEELAEDDEDAPARAKEPATPAQPKAKASAASPRKTTTKASAAKRTTTTKAAPRKTPAKRKTTAKRPAAARNSSTTKE